MVDHEVVGAVDAGLSFLLAWKRIPLILAVLIAHVVMVVEIDEMLLLVLGFLVLFWLLRFLYKLYLGLLQRLWLSHILVDGLGYVWVDADAPSGFIYFGFIIFARNQFKVIEILITRILISCWFYCFLILSLGSVCVFRNRLGIFWELQDVEEVVATFLCDAMGLLIINPTPRHFL